MDYFDKYIEDQFVSDGGVLPKGESTRSPGCSMAGREAERKLVEIYERQAVDSAIFLMTKLNRGQIRQIRELNPKLADFFAECLSH